MARQELENLVRAESRFDLAYNAAMEDEVSGASLHCPQQCSRVDVFHIGTFSGKLSASSGGCLLESTPAPQLRRVTRTRMPYDRLF